MWKNLLEECKEKENMFKDTELKQWKGEIDEIE